MTGDATQRFDVAALRRDQPIDRVIAGYGIELRPSGRGLVGRCPFHDDRGRPNLYVYPDQGRWWCFRCGSGGDAIDFLRRREGLSFREACRRLGGHPAGASTGSSVPGRAARTKRWDRLTLEEQVVMNTACALYAHSLWRNPRALAYVRERGIPDRVIRGCALGYADGHSLETYLRRRSGLRVAQSLGLLRRAGRGDRGRPLREALAGRIVIPELRRGQCIWFIGRALEDGPNQPKYLAPAGERPVLGYERAAGQREAFLCEGVFDYLTAVAWRLPAFSPCGTYLPAERLGFLARAKVVYGVLDGDAAGAAAADKFAGQIGPRWVPLRLPDGCDLNDLGRRPDGSSLFFRLLSEARAARRKEASLHA